MKFESARKAGVVRVFFHILTFHASENFSSTIEIEPKPVPETRKSTISNECKN
jgi:hypothetical protein